MPYQPMSRDIRPSNDLPDNLGHRPVYALPYESFDGPWANDTDARYISVGNAQWWPGTDVSVKIMRYLDSNRWARQAEELPLHRAIDATIFLTMAIFCTDDGTLRVPPGTFDNQDIEITITRENRTYRESVAYRQWLNDNREQLRERLRALARVLEIALESNNS